VIVSALRSTGLVRRLAHAGERDVVLLVDVLVQVAVEVGERGEQGSVRGA